MEYTTSFADISACGKYRYRLTREWNGVHDPENGWYWTGDKDGNGEPYGWKRSCVFIMLNPSTADGEQDDPTIRRCVDFAARLGYAALDVVNLFAYRATNPKELLALGHNDDPVGVRNQEVIETICNAQDTGMVIAAWGAHGGHIGQDETVLGWLHPRVKVQALGLTSGGQPRHPLYLPKTSLPFPYRRTP